MMTTISEYASSNIETKLKKKEDLCVVKLLGFTVLTNFVYNIEQC